MATLSIRNMFANLRVDGIGFKTRRSLFLPVINKTGSAIAANKAVTISGYDTATKRPKIVLADSDAAGAHTDVWITRNSVADGAKANVWKGFMSTANIDTSGATAAGDPVYLSTTAGAFTHTAPTGTGVQRLLIGYVQVKSSTVGQIAWDVQPVVLYATIDQNA